MAVKKSTPAKKPGKKAAKPVENPRADKSVAILAMGRSLYDYVALCKRLGHPRRVADEAWAINDMGSCLTCDRIFMMDDIVETLGPKYSWVQNHPGPIYTVKEYPDYPGMVAYPLEDVINNVKFSYFNSTVAYAMGLALLEGWGTIKMYGVDFTYDDLHTGEKGRGCVEFYMGIAAQRGINFEIAPTSTLFDVNVLPHKRMYGYVDPIPQVSFVDGKWKVEMVKNPDPEHPFYGYKAPKPEAP